MSRTHRADRSRREYSYAYNRNKVRKAKGNKRKKRAKREIEKKADERREQWKELRNEQRSRDKVVTKAFGKRGHRVCGRKIKYHTKDMAEDYCRRLQKKAKPGIKLSVYECDICGGWHLTSHELTPLTRYRKQRELGMPLTVQEVLEAAREAALQIRKLEEDAEIRREGIGPQGYSMGVHAKNGILDPMRKVDQLLDWESDLRQEIEKLREPIEDAWEIVCGIACVSDDLTTELMTRYYLQGESWRSIVDGNAVTSTPPLSDRAEQLAGLPHSKQIEFVSRVIELALPHLETIGLAHLRQMGRADEWEDDTDGV